MNQTMNKTCNNSHQILFFIAVMIMIFLGLTLVVCGSFFFFIFKPVPSWFFNTSGILILGMSVGVCRVERKFERQNKSNKEQNTYCEQDNSCGCCSGTSGRLAGTGGGRLATYSKPCCKNEGAVSSPSCDCSDIKGCD